MPSGYPCPNPACAYVFPADAVRGEAMACPRCGARYRFRQAPPPLPKVAPPPVPVAPPVAGPALAPTPGPLVRPRRPRRRGWGWLRALVVFLTVCLCVGGVLYAYRDELADLLRDGPGQRASFRAQGNFSFRAAPGWRPDEPLRDRTRANLAVTLARPRGHMALFYLDHQARSYTDAQLLDKALRQLRAYFPQLEYEDPFRGGDGRTGTLGGEPALVFAFSGTDPNDVPVRGQAYVLSRQGFAYWLYFWGPEDNYDKLTERWEALRGGFKLYDEREGWRPRPREVQTFTGSALAYQLRYHKDVWKAEDSPKDADPACELRLRGVETDEDERTGRRRPGELAATAPEVLALVLPKAADAKAAAAAALEYVKKKQAELIPRLAVEPLPPRDPPKPGGLIDRVDRLRLVLGGTNERYLVLAVASRPDGVLALVCECLWERKDYWEQEFNAVLGSARPGEGPQTPPPPKEAAPAARPPAAKPAVRGPGRRPGSGPAAAARASAPAAAAAPRCRAASGSPGRAGGAARRGRGRRRGGPSPAARAGSAAPARRGTCSRPGSR
jgi:hypothetical protein